MCFFNMRTRNYQICHRLYPFLVLITGQHLGPAKIQENQSYFFARSKLLAIIFARRKICRFKTKRRKLHFKEIIFLPKSMKTLKTYFSKKFWFYFIIFKYCIENS